GVACAVWLAQRMRIRTIVTFQSMLRGYNRAFAALDRVFGWSHWPVTFTAISAPLAREIQPLFRTPVTVLPNAIDASYWRVTRAAANDGVVRLVSTMRLAPRKRAVPLIEAVARARALAPQ